jgi:hypothetical protein
MLIYPGGTWKSVQANMLQNGRANNNNNNNSIIINNNNNPYPDRSSALVVSTAVLHFKISCSIPTAYTNIKI